MIFWLPTPLLFVYTSNEDGHVWGYACNYLFPSNRGFPGGLVVKNLPAMQEIQVRSLGGGDPLEEEMATHFSILAWKIPWTEELDRLQSRGSQRVRHGWSDLACIACVQLQRGFKYCPILSGCGAVSMLLPASGSIWATLPFLLLGRGPCSYLFILYFTILCL